MSQLRIVPWKSALFQMKKVFLSLTMCLPHQNRFVRTVCFVVRFSKDHLAALVGYTYKDEPQAPSACSETAALCG